jgi:hypothetical protein
VPLINNASTSSGFLFALPDAAPGAMLLHTTSMNATTALESDPQTRWHSSGPTTLSGIQLGKISRLSVFTRPATASGIVMRFALRVNGVWHVSAASFSQVDAAAWEQRVLCPSLTLWHPAVFTSGSFLDDDVTDNAPVALPASGLVSGYGLYADTGTLSGPACRVRIDSFEVITAEGARTDPLVTYAGNASIEELHDGLELADGSVLVAGSAENLDWISAPKIALPALSLPNRVTGRTAFVLQLAPDLQSVLGVWHLPAGQVQNIRWIKTSAKPGSTIAGAIYLSGACDATSGDYFIARLNGDFITSTPTGFEWLRMARASSAAGDNLGLQTWDVGGDGRVVFADETDGTLRVFSLNAAGSLMKLADLRGSHWASAGTLDNASRQAGIGSDLPAAVVSGISFPADLRSWTETDRLTLLPDGNGQIKRGRWPLDLFTPVQDRDGGTTGTISYGYTGYRSVGRHRLAGIAVNRDTNDFSLGFNVQSRFWDAAAGIEQPDFEPAVIAFTATGALKWWSRLYHEVVDADADGQIDSGETRLSPPDQYVDALAYDHAASPAQLVVAARCHGNATSNFWSGNAIAAHPGRVSFHHRFTGTEGNIHLSWIAKLRDTDGRLECASFLAGYFRTTTLTQSLYSDPNLDAWPSHNAGWPNLTTTRIEPGSLRTDATGRVYLTGRGPRTVTTAGAWQKLPKITPTLNQGISPWNAFVRVFTPDLGTLAYSSALTGAWTYPTAGAEPVGADNTDLRAVFPSTNGLITLGSHRATAGIADGNPVPVTLVPAWGASTPQNVSALLARLTFAVTTSITPLQSWRTQFFGSNLSSLVAADTADPDGDGFANLTEYGLGTHPLQATPGLVPFVNPGGQLQLEILRPSGRTDVATFGEISTDLIDWSTLFTDIETILEDQGDGTERLIIRTTAPIGLQPQVFLRLRVLASP